MFRMSLVFFYKIVSRFSPSTLHEDENSQTAAITSQVIGHCFFYLHDRISQCIAPLHTATNMIFVKP